MSFLDWLITSLPLLLVAVVAVYCQPYARSVANFMSGGRSAGRYLLAIAGSELGLGAVVFVGAFEVTGKSGFTLGWWGMLGGPIGLIVTICGFVVYRFRETRAMTLAQFFEIRYSKAFRLFTGGLAFVAGIVNFGVIPAIGARCLVYFLGIPPETSILGLSIPTYIPLMGLFLSITLLVALTGGLITVMVINCIEGMISQFFYLILTVALLSMFSWSQISTVLMNHPHGESLMNPFDSGSLKDFNIWYVLMSLCINIYGTRAWQNSGAYYSAAYSPHESRMGNVLGGWKNMGKGCAVTLLGVAAVTFLHHPDFAAQRAPVIAALQHIGDSHVREQMQAPIALSYLLPMGAKGVFCVVLLMGIFGGDATHLHSWGSIFVQDVLVPLRKKPFGPRQHIRALRLSIAGVALFAFLFGSLYRQTEYVFMWFSITMAIYVGGAGAAIIGGLYWKKGTTAGAWAALLTGSALSFGGILIREYNDHFPLNGTQISFFASLIAIGIYVIVSLLTCRENFNMDRMLHRGEYAAIKEQVGDAVVVSKSRVWLGRLIGIDEDFTRGDKWIAGTLFGWSLLWCVVFLAGTAWNLIAPWPDWVWSLYWEITGIGIPILFAVVMCVWFTWGGLKDMRDLFRRLQAQKLNPLDDGTVVNHQNLDEIAVAETRK